MEESKYVILGGGMVAGYAAKQLVESGMRNGQLAILSADDAVPYERPPLSKGFLAGKDAEESIRINPAEFYEQHGIDLRLRCRVSGVDAGRRRLFLAQGGEFGFEKLVVATGARARTLDIPGGALGNVHYLRSLDDSKAIRRHAENVKRAAVVGGGFIAMEVASVMAQKGVEVTMILREERIWKQFFTPEMSAFFESYYAARGVQLVKRSTLRELRGEGSVKSAVLAGGQAIDCEMVVAGVGVRPETDMLASSGIEVGDGVMVNEFLETSRPDILAAGDVANYQDVLFRKRRRVEHWDNAVTQGQYCARSLMGERTPYRHVPYFFSDVFDLSYEFWGDPAGADATLHRGDLKTNSFSVWWVSQGKLVAAFVMNRPDAEREAAPKWIESRAAVSAGELEALGR
jgi:NADPH-dependent 2,4-dienoyl-CoA reductase/sulfur reductase-like enzyme